MGFSDDEFYTLDKEKKKKFFLFKKKKHRYKETSSNSRGFSFLVTFLSSLSSAILAVGLYSYLSNPNMMNRAGTNYEASRMSAETASKLFPTFDPYERIIQAADKVRPAVVSVLTRTNGSAYALRSLEDAAGAGSGIIYEKKNGKAYIVTNNHVIAGAESMDVLLVDGTLIPANLVGKDHISDLAVLEIPDTKIHSVAEIGDSSKLRGGETVVALGSPLGLGDSLTSGIVSNTLRTVPVSLKGDGMLDWEKHMIQTDAAINEGNSGGALVNLSGRVVGLNSMKFSTGTEGIAFAIPIENVMNVAKEIVKNGRVIRPFLGIDTADLQNDDHPLDEEFITELHLPKQVLHGVVVTETVDPALKANLQIRDVITRIDEVEVADTMQFLKYIYDHKKVGDEVEITYYRNGVKRSSKVVLAETPVEEEYLK